MTPPPHDDVVLRFSGPTEIITNECIANYYIPGAPHLDIDTDAKVIELRFRPRPPDIDILCISEYRPVCGLKGTFGPVRRCPRPYRPRVLLLRRHRQVPDNRRAGTTHDPPVVSDDLTVEDRLSVEVGRSL
jgi:hypothetical protein